MQRFLLITSYDTFYYSFLKDYRIINQIKRYDIILIYEDIPLFTPAMHENKLDIAAYIKIKYTKRLNFS